MLILRSFSRFILISLALLGLSLPLSSHASVVIEYSDVGSDLFFSWSGSLNVIAGDGIDPPGGPTYATIGIQSSGNWPTFYSAPQSHPPGIGVSYTGTNNPGLFATSAPDFTQSIMPGSTSTGLPFLFRINNALTGTTAVNIWADWGAANTLFTGTMTIANQSIASMGMVDGYSLQTNIGDISFVAVSAVPVPAAVWLFGTALIGLVGFGKRGKTKVA